MMFKGGGGSSAIKEKTRLSEPLFFELESNILGQGPNYSPKSNPYNCTLFWANEDIPLHLSALWCSPNLS